MPRLLTFSKPSTFKVSIKNSLSRRIYLIILTSTCACVPFNNIYAREKLKPPQKILYVFLQFAIRSFVTVSQRIYCSTAIEKRIVESRFLTGIFSCRYRWIPRAHHSSEHLCGTRQFTWKRILQRTRSSIRRNATSHRRYIYNTIRSTIEISAYYRAAVTIGWLVSLSLFKAR